MAPVEAAGARLRASGNAGLSAVALSDARRAGDGERQDNLLNDRQAPTALHLTHRRRVSGNLDGNYQAQTVVSRHLRVGVRARSMRLLPGVNLVVEPTVRAGKRDGIGSLPQGSSLNRTNTQPATTSECSYSSNWPSSLGWVSELQRASVGRVTRALTWRRRCRKTRGSPGVRRGSEDPTLVSRRGMVQGPKSRGEVTRRCLQLNV